MATGILKNVDLSHVDESARFMSGNLKKAPLWVKQSYMTTRIIKTQAEAQAIVNTVRSTFPSFFTYKKGRLPVKFVDSKRVKVKKGGFSHGANEYLIKLYTHTKGNNLSTLLHETAHAMNPYDKHGNGFINRLAMLYMWAERNLVSPEDISESWKWHVARNLLQYDLMWDIEKYEGRERIRQYMKRKYSSIYIYATPSDIGKIDKYIYEIHEQVVCKPATKKDKKRSKRTRFPK